MSAALLVRVLRDPARVVALPAIDWNALLAAAKAERLIATLAFLLEGLDVPAAARAVLDDARAEAKREAQQALWEADRAAFALRDSGIRVVLLKGAAYAAAGLDAARGRFIGDLDILVPRVEVDRVERALIAAGWEWVKEDAYDDAYYRRWMHELPPLIHAERDRMIDVHHTILPLTARPRPDADALLADAVAVTGALHVLAPEDRVVHAAAHMLADGDLQGGLRNLWDIHCLLPDCDPAALDRRAGLHGLAQHVGQARRLAAAIYGSGGRLTLWDRVVRARLLARDGWARETRKPLVFAFYVRSHLLRMPLPILLRHLFTKWRGGHRPR